VNCIRLALFFALCSLAQQTGSIRVPVRLVSVPTLVVSKDGKYIPGLPAEKFQLTDNGRPRRFTLDTEDVPVSIAVVVQVDQDVREYLPFLSKVGALLDNSLAAASGEDALITYNDEISVVKRFGKGDMQTAMEKVKPAGHEARMIDAGLRAVALLKERTGKGSRVLLFIGQPKESGSAAKVDVLAEQAEQENIQVYSLTLPLLDKSFVSDSFHLEGLGSQWWKGGYKASVELTRAVPALRRAAQSSAGTDPFSYLTVATGGLQLHFRKQKQLEDTIIAMGDALRSRYFLSFTPDAPDNSFHTISVQVDVPDATVYARPGYRMDTPNEKALH
jgi:VWFA-related protein